MPLEDLVGPDKFLDALNRAWPLDDDQRPQGDDHIRGTKNTILNTFGALDRLYDLTKGVFWNEPAASQANETGSLPAAGGTTAQRPASPVAYDWRWNSEIETKGPALEVYDGTAWRRFSAQLLVDNFLRGNQYLYPGTEADPTSRSRVMWSTDGTFDKRVAGLSVIEDDGTAQDYSFTLFTMLQGVLTNFLVASQTGQLSTDLTDFFIDGKRAVKEDGPIYTGGGQTLTVPGNNTWNHGLSYTPRLYRFVLQCQTADAGYAIGDEVDFSSTNGTEDTDSGLSTGAHSCWANATQVGVSSSDRAPIVAQKSGFWNRINTANWHVIPLVYG